MSHAWEWSKVGSGTQLNSIYEYEGKTKECRKQDLKKSSKAQDWGSVYGVENIKKQLQKGPLTVAVDAN